MLYSDFQGEALSLLGFGTMRLPTLPDGTIDEAQVHAMVGYALDHGVNYFDTAWPYHSGESERVIGRVLEQYPREKWHLASKFPGHQVMAAYNPADIFEEQLRKCRVDYFDYYLLHNVYESSMATYFDPKWGIIDYFREQKRRGRIRHLGFSSHGRVENLREFLDLAAPLVELEFCQIQLNYLDWTLQDARAKVELLNERHIPIWVMEPVRGGRLCRLDAQDEATLRGLRPEESIPAWGFRFVQDVPGVTMVLSGMSSMQQMEENIRTFEEKKPLTQQETQALLSIAEGMKDTIPCTGCRYCVDHCPKGLNIPLMMETCSELRFSATTNTAMRLEFLPADRQPSACIGCGACARMCPQKIDIPGVMKELTARLETIPKWADICRQREEAARRLRGQ